jgi:hypothetical protein
MSLKKSSTKDKSLQYVHAVVYGESGIGKTTSLGTLPQDCTVIAAAERGLLPLRDKSYEVLLIESWQDVRELVRTFMEPYQVGDKPARILAIDSLSEFSELCKRQILEVDRKALVGERTKGKESKPTGIYDDQLTMEDWGLYRTRMSQMISAVCHLPIHTIFTSLPAWTEDKRTGTLHVTPNLSGKLAMECPAFFGEVLYMEASKDSEGNPSRLWRTYNDGQILAKDESGALDPYEPTNWTALFRKILKSGGDK